MAAADARGTGRQDVTPSTGYDESGCIYQVQDDNIWLKSAPDGNYVAETVYGDSMIGGPVTKVGSWEFVYDLNTGFSGWIAKPFMKLISCASPSHEAPLPASGKSAVTSAGGLSGESGQAGGSAEPSVAPADNYDLLGCLYIVEHANIALKNAPDGKDVATTLDGEEVISAPRTVVGSWEYVYDIHTFQAGWIAKPFIKYVRCPSPGSE